MVDGDKAQNDIGIVFCQLVTDEGMARHQTTMKLVMSVDRYDVL